MKLQLIACVTALLLGCSASGADKGLKGSGASNTGATSSTGDQPSLGLGGNGPSLGGSLNMGDVVADPNPETCEAAALGKTYVGCDFWPTIAANPVWQEFEPAVVVANGTKTDATVTITGPDGFNQTVTVKAGGLENVSVSRVSGLTSVALFAGNSWTWADADAACTSARANQIETVFFTIIQWSNH